MNNHRQESGFVNFLATVIIISYNRDIIIGYFLENGFRVNFSTSKNLNLPTLWFDRPQGS